MKEVRLKLLIIAIILAGYPLAAVCQYLSGYDQELHGETITYDCQQPDTKTALLVRSLNMDKYIEWLTAPITENEKRKEVELILICGIDVNAENNHAFQMFVNDEFQFSFRNPADTLQKNWNLEGKNGIQLRFQGDMIDKYGDLFGYMFLRVPTSVFDKNRQLKIKVTGESAGSRSWFMVFKYQAFQGVKFIEQQAITKENGMDHQLVRMDILHFDEPANAFISLDEVENTFPVKLGFNSFMINVPLVTVPKEISAVVRLNDRLITEEKIMLHPVQRKTIYMLPHSHNDIGYTHVQTEVEQIQWQNLQDAIKFSRDTQEYPSGSQFKWNTEVMWAVESYVKQANKTELNEFIEAVQKGWLELNGLYANILTGLCRPEELYRMIEPAIEMAEMCKVDVKSAMITDIPGYSWGMVPVLAQNGIRYFSIGTNTFHRIGNIVEVWGDKPFYWESPSGNEKILCWVHGKGYSEFHTGLAYTQLRNKLKEQLIFDYINELKETDYLYDMVTMRYNIGSDNGPPDPYLADIVKNWNQKYISPKIVISTVGESFRIFEEKYGKTLPVYRGDLNGYWEDGASSSAAETAMNRQSAEQLTQAGTYLTLTQDNGYPAEKFEEAWKNVLLFSEHTWGSWNSISEPFAEFTLQQWNIKQSYALNANQMSNNFLNYWSDFPEPITSLDIFNTNSWERTDLVILPENMNLAGESITDDEDNIIKSQRLTTGEIVFIAENVPAFGSKRYYLKNKLPEQELSFVNFTDGFNFANDKFDLQIDQQSGAISKLEFAGIPVNLVNSEIFSGLNGYYYVDERSPLDPKTSKSHKVRVKEVGPVIFSVVIESKAPGCLKFEREIRIINGLDRIDIINSIDKTEILEPEGVHIAFPFNIPDGEFRISSQWGYYNPGTELLPGSNMNFFSVNRWLDVSNKDFGVTWVTRDAPLVELDKITMDEIEYGWVNEVPVSQTFLSYIMNNYWETNYKASQGGKAVFRYCLYPHGKFNAVQSEKWGIESHQPLIALPVTSSKTVFKPDYEFTNENLIISALRRRPDNSILARVYNPGTDDELLVCAWKDKQGYLYISDPMGKINSQGMNEILIPARGVVNIIIK